MPKDARDVIAGLERKGFRRRVYDHAFLHLWVDNKKTQIYTKVSHGEKEIRDRLLSVMARQLSISRRQFIQLVDCPLSEVEYQGLLRVQGRIS